jgi:hypothetical protein
LAVKGQAMNEKTAAGWLSKTLEEADKNTLDKITSRSEKYEKYTTILRLLKDAEPIQLAAKLPTSSHA